MDNSDRLASLNFAQFIPPAERERLALQFKRERYESGETIFRQGDSGNAFYIVNKGVVLARAEHRGQAIPRAYFYPTDYFGETALLSGNPRNAAAIVLETAELLVLDRVQFELMIEQYPEVRHHLLEFGQLRERAGRHRFPWQENDEATLASESKHWVALLYAWRPVYAFFVLFLIFMGVYLSPVGTVLPVGLFVLLTLLNGFLLGFVVLLFLYYFLDWRNDQYVVTSARILHIERVFLVREERHEAPIAHVQDVKVEKGMLASLFNFGQVVIQTAGPTGRIVFSHVPHPELIQDVILAPKRQAQSHMQAKEKVAIRQELERLLGIEKTETREGAAPAPKSAAQKPKPTKESIWLTARLIAPLQQMLQRTRDLISFQTHIVSDGGNTITWRKCRWILVRGSIAPIIVGAALVVLFFVIVFANILGRSFALIPFILLFFVFAWWLYAYWDWQNDIYQVSGDRLIDLKRRPLFLAEDRRETTLDRVENLRSDIPGPVAKIFNYGTVTIETAGEEGAFEFHHVHAPIDVHQEIFARLERHRRLREKQARRRRHAEMLEWFEAYDRLKGEQSENKQTESN